MNLDTTYGSPTFGNKTGGSHLHEVIYRALPRLARTQSNWISPQERSLSMIHEKISSVAMHLGPNFSAGLKRQFTTMLGHEAWEAADDFPTSTAVDAFLQLLKSIGSSNRPGIGTNGEGSVTAFWVSGKSRLTVDCINLETAQWTLTRAFDAERVERAAGKCSPDRVAICVRPFSPEVWFD